MGAAGSGLAADTEDGPTSEGSAAGVLKKLLVKADTEGVIEWEVSVDSTVCRAHQRAAGARKKGLPIRAGRVRTASRPSRTTTARGARAAGRPPRFTSPSTPPSMSSQPSSPSASGATHPSSSR
ncbi:hypothetical protein E2651_03810 [Streptomyces sp. MZ04]|nr:hypothetical protein E2651_03810 [Streptomyces sp. MZ04]